MLKEIERRCVHASDLRYTAPNTLERLPWTEAFRSSYCSNSFCSKIMGKEKLGELLFDDNRFNGLFSKIFMCFHSNQLDKLIENGWKQHTNALRKKI
jgi:hypothetical protein